jgi:hypothetical protein
VNLGLSTNCGKQGKYAWELAFTGKMPLISTGSCGSRTGVLVDFTPVLWKSRISVDKAGFYPYWMCMKKENFHLAASGFFP